MLDRNKTDDEHFVPVITALETLHGLQSHCDINVLHRKTSSPEVSLGEGLSVVVNGRSIEEARE